MRAQSIERLPSGRPRYTVQGNPPLSKRGGCWTFVVVDHARGVIVHGPCTISQEAAAACGRFSQGADVALMSAPVDDARQMRLEV